jgi:hypothetical protein
MAKEKTVYYNGPKGHPRDRIIIHESVDMPKEGRFIGLNGHHSLAKPGVEIDLPRPVREMLDTRFRTETIHGRDGQDYTKDIPRVTYQLVAENVEQAPEGAADGRQGTGSPTA